MTSQKDVAKAAGVACNTKHFPPRASHSKPSTQLACERLLDTLQRADKTPTLDPAARTAAAGLHKAFTSGRLNPKLAHRIAEEYSPWQVCGLVARVANEAPGYASVDYLVRYWINHNSRNL